MEEEDLQAGEKVNDRIQIAQLARSRNKIYQDKTRERSSNQAQLLKTD